MDSKAPLKTFTEVFKDQDDNEVKVETTQILGFRGIKLQAKLTRAIMPLFSGVKSDSFDAEVSVKYLLENLTESKVEELIKDLVVNTTVDNKDLSNKGNFDLVFAGNYKLLFATLKFIIEKNNFFGGSDIGIMIKKLENLIPMSQK